MSDVVIYYVGIISIDIIARLRQSRQVSGGFGRSGEKQVAIRLELSKHTVHDYVKLIYREFEVRSRGELLARFVH